MERFHAIAESLLIVPTATLAEHLRHELARSGRALRPNRITTFAGFLECRTPPAPSNFLLHVAVQEAFEKVQPQSFARVRDYHGFRDSLARLANEIPAEAAEGDLAAVLAGIETAVTCRGFALRRRRIELAMQNGVTLPPHIVIDGFFSFPRPELDLLTALASRTRLTITLPDWPGSSAARTRLLAHGFREQLHDRIRRRANTAIFAAPTLERETEEIARRILEESRRGRPFREIGVILRTRQPYAPVLETTFARFGIPARFYFADALVANPAIAFLAAIVRALLDGWNYKDLLEIAQRPISGLSDRFEFALRERVPGAGLPIALPEESCELLERLRSLDAWRRQKVKPAEWAQRLTGLRSLIPEPPIGDEISRDDLRSWQSAAFALDAFDKALAEAASLSGEPVSLAGFWSKVETALLVESPRTPDRRANVVHVLDAYEARQWELPVVFVCGMIDGIFPRYAREDPLLDEATRRRAGLPGAAEGEAEERCLFELASTRATEKTVFSYARFNRKGDAQVVSPFLDRAGAETSDARVYPRPRRKVDLATPAAIEAPALLAEIGKKHAALAPTSIESFLQCPFQFFAGKTLRLRPRPAAPNDRLNVLLQGNIMHRVLAEYLRNPLFGPAIFDDVFEEECRRARVPDDYRREAVRLEMGRNFEAFLEDREIALGWPSRVEEQFSFALHPRLTLRGRIDRLDVGPRNQTLVIDYKYSAASKIRERTDEDQAGNLVQGGLYMLAAERVFGLKPTGMFYCGLRKGTAWEGWHIPIAGLERTGETVAQGALDEMMRTASAKAAEVFESIASGDVAARPADEKKCAWCDYADICRVESLGAARTTTA